MDPQAPIVPEIPKVEDPERVVSTEQSRSVKPRVERDNHWISILAMAIFVLFSLGVVVFLFYQNQQLKNMLANYQIPVASPTPTATADPTANWKIYTNTAGYSIKYPTSFTTQLLAAGAGNKEADSTTRNLFIFESGASEPYVERYINLEIFQGKPIYNQGTITKATLDNRTVEKIVIPDAKFDTYSAQVGDKGFIEISVSNDPTKKEIADQILSTFKFTTATSSAKPTPTSKACTQEAKVCPDGSSVGRTGPNCEFAPCP